MDKQHLFEQLQSPDPRVRHMATKRIWELWYEAAGDLASLDLRQVDVLLERGAYEEAEANLGELIARFPKFAEAWNRRATLRYMQKRYAESLADCAVVVQLEPDHFGAWHGIGLSHMALYRYDKAIAAFQRALEIQPFANANVELLRTCASKLN